MLLCCRSSQQRQKGRQREQHFDRKQNSKGRRARRERKMQETNIQLLVSFPARAALEERERSHRPSNESRKPPVDHEQNNDDAASIDMNWLGDWCYLV